MRADPLISKIDELKEKLHSADPQKIAVYTQAHIKTTGSGEIQLILPYWDQEIRIYFPSLEISTGPDKNPPRSDIQALVLYHLLTSDGTPETGHWISFSELPGGKFYAGAYQGYTGNEIYRHFKEDFHAVTQAASKIDGMLVSSPMDGAVKFKPLPRVPLLLAYWRGDEDIPGNYRILFDASASHHLPTDVCAILGSMLTKRLIK